MCYAPHPDTGRSDVTIHRLCIQSRDTLSIFFTPGARHIGAMAERAEQLGRTLPISISIGVDPAIAISSCFEPPTTPLGYDELSVAGALRGEPVKLCRCLSVDCRAIALAEYVIEGEVLPHVRIQEDQNRGTGFAMPEFPGYTGPASADCWCIKVKAVTHRRNPIMQTCIGPSEEHVSMAGIPTEASIYGMVERAMPGRLQNVYCASAGGGKYMAVMQFRKLSASDEGRQRQAALLAFSAFSELKHVFLVDEDVDCFDMNDVLWAMNTRFQGDRDIITIPGVARKTANVVLWGGFGINQGLAVDTHVKRLSFRLGLTEHTDPVRIEKDLMLLFPREEWGDVNHRLVWFGRDVCDARKPACTECELFSLCPRCGVKKGGD